MALCHQVANHYLGQYWSRSMTPYGVTQRECVIKYIGMQMTGRIFHIWSMHLCWSVLIISGIISSLAYISYIIDGRCWVERVCSCILSFGFTVLMGLCWGARYIPIINYMVCALIPVFLPIFFLVTSPTQSVDNVTTTKQNTIKPCVHVMRYNIHCKAT